MLKGAVDQEMTENGQEDGLEKSSLLHKSGGGVKKGKSRRGGRGKSNNNNPSLSLSSKTALPDVTNLTSLSTVANRNSTTKVQ